MYIQGDPKVTPYSKITMTYSNLLTTFSVFTCKLLSLRSVYIYMYTYGDANMFIYTHWGLGSKIGFMISLSCLVKKNWETSVSLSAMIKFYA